MKNKLDKKLTLSYEKGDGYLIVVETGEMTPDSGRSSLREIAETAEQQGFSKIMVDARNLSGSMKIHERFFAGEKIARAWRGLKVAILVPAAGSIDKLMENTAVNRGAIIMVTSSLDDAQAWLTGDSVD